jgi:hypothetical protein
MTEQNERLARIEERLIGVAATISTLATRHEIVSLNDRVAKLEATHTWLARSLITAIVSGSAAFAALFGKTAP